MSLEKVEIGDRLLVIPPPLTNQTYMLYCEVLDIYSDIEDETLYRVKKLLYLDLRQESTIDDGIQIVEADRIKMNLKNTSIEELYNIFPEYFI